MLNPQMKGWGHYEFMRRMAEARKEQHTPEPPKPEWAPGSLEWQAEQEAKTRPKSRQLRSRARLARLRADRIPNRRESGQDPDMDGAAVSQPKLIVVRERCDLCVDAKT